MIRTRERIRNAGGSSTTPAIQPLRTVVTQNRINSGAEAQAGKDRQCFRWKYYIACDCTELIASFDGWQMTGTGEQKLTNAYGIAGVAFEGINGTTVIAEFSGSQSKTINAGDVDIQTDPLYPSDFGLAGSYFPAGTEVWVRGIATLTTAGHVLPYTPAANSHITGQQSAWWDSTNPSTTESDVLNQIGEKGVFTITGQTFSNRTTGVRAKVFGRPVSDSSVRSCVAIGDSIAETMNDGATDIPNNNALKIHGLGFVQRSTRETDNTGAIPMLNLARSSTRSYDVSGGTRTKQYYKYARYGIDEYGTNNMPAHGASLTDLQDSLKINWADMKTAGVEKIIRTEYLCKCTSTDNFMTVANQTVDANWTVGSAPELMNAWFVDEVTEGRIDVVLDTSTVKDGSNVYKWGTNTPENIANYMAADTVHPAYRGHEAIAVVLRHVIRNL